MRAVAHLGILILAVGAAAAASRATADATGPADAGRDGPKRQVERVMNAGLPFAERLLATRGEFAPFGAAMLQEGLIQNLNADTEPDATAEQVLSGLLEGLRKGAAKGDYKAIGIFSLVEMQRPGGDETLSAVHVALEHSAGYCVDVYYPVVLRGEGLVLDEPFAGKRSGTVFDSCT